MQLLLVSLALTFPVAADDKAQPTDKVQAKHQTINLDGEWNVVYMEMDGKRADNKGFSPVTIKNNVVTCRHDGKEKSWRLEFGPHHMVRCTEQSDGKPIVNGEDKADPSAKGYHTHHGVYCATQHVFCVSANKGMDRRPFSTTNAAPKEGRPGQEGRQGQEGRTQPESRSTNFGEQGPHAANFIIILQRRTDKTSR